MTLPPLIRHPDQWARMLGLVTLIGIECGLVGPFGSYLANPYTRIAYWISLFWAGGLILWPSVSAAVSVGPRLGLPPVFSGTAAALIACVPLALLAAAGCYMFWPVHASGIRTVEWYGLTLPLALPTIFALVWLDGVLGRARAPDHVGTPDADAGTASTAHADLPPHMFAGALCLQMEDHHVRVHMPGGSYLHLATMRQIVDRLGETRGLQVHRSWWVASHAVQGWAEDGRSVTLLLANGLTVPVARSRVAAVRARGWLAPKAVA
jgi:hypothetical protein